MSSSYRTDSRPVSSQGHQQAALRPRNRRLISGLDDPPDSAPNAANIAPQSSLNSPFASPFGSRAPSPIPSKHPSRSSSALPNRRNGALGSSLPGQQDQLGNDLANSLSGLWGKSWTSLQGLASNVLGSDVMEEMVKDKSPQRSRRPLQATHSQWGPQARDESQPGAGSREERKALVREKKRQELLMSTGNVGSEGARTKRRTSDDFDASSAAREESALDALVYVHNVKRDDTLAGLSIRYNCQLAIIKRANRLWSNDAIQSRKVVVIPVDSCPVRGKRVPSPPPTPASALAPAAANNGTKSNMSPSYGLSPDQRPVPRHTPQSSVSASEPVSPQSVAIRPDTEEPPWKHDSWIHLDGQPQPVEIARMSRQDLGYFPRARRKSKSYSDLDTPSASFDLPRPSITVSDVTSTSCAPPAHRKRGSSGSNTRWMTKMSGPGGVGSLGGKGVSSPGPSSDSLNKASEKLSRAIGKHLPAVATPRDGGEDFDDSLSQTSGQGGGLESFGGAIEGWVRKIAQTAAKAVEQPPPGQLEIRRNLGLRPRGSGGDLIELSSAFEIGPDEDDEDQVEENHRGRTMQLGDTHAGSRAAAKAIRTGYDDGGGAASKRKGD